MRYLLPSIIVAACIIVLLNKLGVLIAIGLFVGIGGYSIFDILIPNLDFSIILPFIVLVGSVMWILKLRT